MRVTGVVEGPMLLTDVRCRSSMAGGGCSKTLLIAVNLGILVSQSRMHGDPGKFCEQFNHAYHYTTVLMEKV